MTGWLGGLTDRQARPGACDKERSVIRAYFQVLSYQQGGKCISLLTHSFLLWARLFFIIFNSDKINFLETSEEMLMRTQPTFLLFLNLRHFPNSLFIPKLVSQESQHAPGNIGANLGMG